MAAIRSIETAVPDTVIRQDALRDLLREQPGYGPLGKRLVTAAFDGSAIETRRSVLREFGADAVASDPSLSGAATGRLGDPTTAARNDAYALHSKPLLIEAARKAIAAAPGLDAADITHVVTVSCTGFYSPGPDFVLVRELGLAPSTQRYHLGFMGCYAAFPALRMAAQFCEADPDAVVLVVSVELCSLHFHVDDDPDTIVAASVFGDGAAAAIVSSRGGDDASPSLILDAFESTIVAEGETAMAWTIGDHGFDMVLSAYVPRIVEQNIGAALAPLLARVGTTVDDVPLWAIHPGGRSILDRVESTLGLTERQVAPSRRVLRDLGNMSSASVLFVLADLLHAEDAAGSGERIAGMAFGPGLTVETALFTRVAARFPEEPARGAAVTDAIA